MQAKSSSLDSIIGRALRDEEFRARLLTSPVEASIEAGYDLSDDDRAQLMQLDARRAAGFFDKMGDKNAPMAWCSENACYEGG